MSIVKPCPRCSADVNVPPVYGYTTMPIGKTCRCTPFDDVLSGTPSIEELAKTVRDLQLWVDLLVRLIPVFRLPAFNLNREVAETARPPQSVLNMIASADSGVKYHLATCQGKIINCNICLYCGSVSNIHPTDAEDAPRNTDRVNVKSFATCAACINVRNTNPQIFEWIGKILYVLYSIAGRGAPALPPKVRNILVGE